MSDAAVVRPTITAPCPLTSMSCVAPTLKGAEPVVTEATVRFEGNQQQVTFSQPDDFFIIGAGGVCRGAGRVYRRHRRIYNQLQFEPNP